MEDTHNPVGRPRKGSGPQLSRPAIVDGAFRVLQREGKDGVTIRKVAAELGVRSASLYWHVSNKDDLLQLMAEEICRDIQRPDRSESWEDQVRSVAHAYRNRLRTVRDSATILLETVPITPERLAIVEQMLALFSEAGFRGREILLAASMINDYVVSFSLNEAHQAQEQVGADPGVVFAQLPAERFPYIRALAEHMMMDDLDTHFEYGLDVIISGLRSRLPRRGTSGGEGTS